MPDPSARPRPRIHLACLSTPRPQFRSYEGVRWRTGPSPFLERNRSRKIFLDELSNSGPAVRLDHESSTTGPAVAEDEAMDRDIDVPHPEMEAAGVRISPVSPVAITLSTSPTNKKYN
jgi:hypothetical protein